MYTSNYLSSFPSLYNEIPREKSAPKYSWSDKLIYHHTPCLPNIVQATARSGHSFSLEVPLLGNLPSTGSGRLFWWAAGLVFPLLVPNCGRIDQWSRPSRHGAFLMRKHSAEGSWVWGFIQWVHLIWRTQRETNCTILMRGRKLFTLAFRICMTYYPPFL